MVALLVYPVYIYIYALIRWTPTEQVLGHFSPEMPCRYVMETENDVT